MPKQPRTKTPSQWAAHVVEAVTGQTFGPDYYQRVEARLAERKGKNPAAVALGKLGGLKGGKARAAALTPEQRSEIGRKGARARWGR